MSAESFMHVEHQVGQPNNDDREDKNVSANGKLSPGKEIKRRPVEKEGGTAEKRKCRKINIESETKRNT